MKKFLAGLILGLVLATAPVALAAGRIRLIVDGRDVTPSDVAPQNINGRVMVPARALAEALGATAGWDSGRNAVTVSTKGYAAFGPLGPDWVGVRSLSVPANIDNITATNGTVTLIKGNTSIILRSHLDENSQLLPDAMLSVVVDGNEVESGVGRRDQADFYVPHAILVKYGFLDA